MLSVPGKKCFATITQAKCVFALISDLLPLDWCHIIYMRHFVATKGVFKGGGLNPPKFFLKSEGKEAVRKKMKKYVGGGGVTCYYFLGGLKIF